MIKPDGTFHKSQVSNYFNEFLDVMERAWFSFPEDIREEEFRRLEEKIRHEITYHRRQQSQVEVLKTL